MNLISLLANCVFVGEFVSGISLTGEIQLRFQPTLVVEYLAEFVVTGS
jgi:hypothetical protein